MEPVKTTSCRCTAWPSLPPFRRWDPKRLSAGPISAPPVQEFQTKYKLCIFPSEPADPTSSCQIPGKRMSSLPCRTHTLTVTNTREEASRQVAELATDFRRSCSIGEVPSVIWPKSVRFPRTISAFRLAGTRLGRLLPDTRTALAPPHKISPSFKADSFKCVDVEHYAIPKKRKPRRLRTPGLLTHAGTDKEGGSWGCRF
jgi:hypothetical protein